MDHSSYFEYLRKRSFVGLIYRYCLLYPRLCRNIQGRTLDVGCGVGDLLAYRSNSVGVDINPYTVEWCESRGVEAHQMTVDHIPFDDADFQSVLLDNVLEHIEEPQPILQEIRRVLIPGGRLLVGVPGLRGYDCDSDHKVFYDESNLQSVVEAQGFRLSKFFYTPFRWQWLNRNMPQYCLYGVFVAGD